MQVKCNELTDAVKIGIVILDENFKIVDVNREILVKGNMKKEMLLNTPFLSWFPEKKRDEIEKILRDVWNGKKEWGKGSYELYPMGSDKPIIVDIRVRRLKDSLVVTIIDKSWLYKTLRELNIVQSAVDNMDEGLMVTDVNGTILFVNPGFTKMTGYSEEEAIGQNPRILKSGKQDRKFYENMWNTILSGQIWKGSLINKRKDGTLYWEEMTIVPVKDNKGRITNFVAVKRDVSERKKLEEEIRKKEEYYRKIFSMSNDGIFIETLDGKIVDLNEAAAKMLGYKRKELLGKGLEILLPGDPKEKIDAMIKKLKKDGYARLETFNKHKDGHLVPLELSISLLNIEGENLALVIARDLSFREEQETKYRILSEMASDAVILINESGVIEYWNPASERIFGYTKEEALNKPFWNLIVPEKYLPNSNFPKLVKNGFERASLPFLRRFDVQAKRKDGKLIDVELGISIFNISGKKYALAVIRDISERVEMERKLKKQTDELKSIYRFSLELGSIIDTRILSQRVYEEIKKLIDFDSFALGIIDWNKKTIKYDILTSGEKNLGPIEIKISPKDSLSGWVVSSKRALLIKNFDEEKDSLPAKWIEVEKMPKSWLGVPLMYKGEVLGILIVQSFKPYQYDENDKDFIMTLAAQLAIIIKNTELFNELKISEEKYRGIINSAIVGVTTVDLNGNFTFVNDKMVEMLGYTREEILKKSIYDITTEEGKKIFREKMKRRAMGLSDYYENSFVRKDGTVIDVLINAAPLRDTNGKVIGSIGVVMDITERKRKTEELRRKNAVLSALYNISLKIGEAPSLEDISDSIYKEFKKIFDFDWFYIALYDKKKRILKYPILVSKGKRIENYSIKYDPKNSLVSYVLHTREPLIIKDFDKKSLPCKCIIGGKDEKNYPKSIVLLPLLYKREKLGVISLQSEKKYAYDDNDVKYLSTFSKALSIFIKNIQLYQNVKNAKQRMEKIVNTSLVGIAIVDLNGKITFANNALLNMLGYSKNELIGKRIFELTTTEGQKLFKNMLERRKIGVTDYYEINLIKKNRKEIWTLINASPLKDENGKVVGSFAMVLDITNRRKMEERIKSERERYKRIFESMANIVVLIQNERIIYINKQFEAVTRYKMEEVLNRHFIDFVHPDMRDIVLSNYRRRMRGLEVPDHYIVKLIAKSGKDIWMDIRTSLIDWEQGKADLVSLVDITEIKEMEDKLITLDEIARKLKMAKSKDEIYDIAIQNLYRVLNLYNSAILEIKDHTLVIVKSRGYVNPDIKLDIDSEKGITPWVARNNLPYYSPNTDEDPLYIVGVRGAKSEYATPISIDDKVYGVLDVQKDEPYSISEDDMKLIDLLANNMAVALRSLEIQKDLEKAKNLQELMLHIVSHDLKNPLAVIEGYIDLLREEFDPSYLDAMQMAVEEASSIIEKARLFSKLGAGKIDEERKLIDLKEEIEEVISLLSHKYPSGKINMAADKIEIYAFPIIREVFSNIIDNAFKYGANNVNISINEKEDSVEIRIADDGPGIPKEMRNTIFDAFKTYSKKGSGLGLNIVKMIVEMHDGKVWVEENKPKGSVFVIQLPKD